MQQRYLIKNFFSWKIHRVGFSALGATSFPSDNLFRAAASFIILGANVLLLVYGNWKKRNDFSLCLGVIDFRLAGSHGHWKLRVNIACVLCKPRRGKKLCPLERINCFYDIFASIVPLKLRLEAILWHFISATTAAACWGRENLDVTTKKPTRERAKLFFFGTRKCVTIKNQ